MSQVEAAVSSSVPETAVDVLRTSGLAALLAEGGDPCQLAGFAGVFKLPLCAGE